ncbi:MAG: site-specific integrase [Candidatus Cloacimonetes bacterium]|jgi:site-specific recombinase XerD|nr:site-specific integrase [archaeon]MBT4334112.1 site-specific integrase [Candidatus Cloacimonadota bacterium]
MGIIETDDYMLTPISNRRYKIDVSSFKFGNTHAAKIQGCYFSGPQKSWVMPQTKECLNKFQELFSSKLRIEIPPFEKAMKDFCDQLIIKRYSQNTIVIYKDHIAKFFNYYSKINPQDLTDEQVKDYMLFLLNEKKISYSYQKQVISAIKFYFEKILRRETKKYYFEIPRHRKQTLPIVLTKKELIAFFNELKNIKNLVIFKTIYSGGFRLSELVNLKISDIDSEMMLINIRGGKGMKDRVTILSDDLLILLRKYFKEYKPKTWLFEPTENKQFSPRAIQKMFHLAFNKTGIDKHATVHTLRHTFATHMLENGEDVRKIQRLLGHKNIKTTEIYTHITTEAIRNIRSPLDNLKLEKDKK